MTPRPLGNHRLRGSPWSSFFLRGKILLCRGPRLTARLFPGSARPRLHAIALRWNRQRALDDIMRDMGCCARMPPRAWWSSDDPG